MSMCFRPSRLIPALLLTALVLTAPLARAVTVSISADVSWVEVGDEFTVRLRIEDLGGASSLSGFDVALGFDAGAVDWLGFGFDDAATSQNQLDLVEASGFGFLGDASLAASGRITAFGLSGNSQSKLDADQANAFDFISLRFLATAATASARFSILTDDPATLFVDSGSARLPVAFGVSTVGIGIGPSVAGVPVPGSLPLLLTGLALVWGSRQSRSLRRGALAAALPLCVALTASAAEPARSASAKDQPAARTPVTGTITAVQGQRMLVKAADGTLRWTTTSTPLTASHVGRKVRGEGRPVGDTVLVDKLVFD